jgi:outer membrane immunogenic protein
VEVIMRGLLIGIAISLGMVTSFAATDLPVFNTKATIYNWAGFYLGGNIGYGWGVSDTIASLNDPGGGVFAAINPSFNLTGVIGGGQVGYNRQAGKWVFGIEADLQATGQSGSSGFEGGSTSSGCTGRGCSFAPGCAGIACFPPGSSITDALSQKLTWLDTVRGRIGWTVMPTILGYLTGGMAIGGVSTSGIVSATTTPAIGAFSSSTAHAGWTIGAGIETAIGGNWTGKIEYLHVDLGTVSGGPFVTPIVAPSGTFLTGSFSSRLTDNIVRVGLNYRF